MVTCRCCCCWRVHFAAFGIAVFRQLICFATLSPPVVFIASRPPPGEPGWMEVWIAIGVGPGPHWHMTGRTGALHGTSSMEPISAVSLLVTLQLFCVFFLVSCSTCFVSRIAGVLATLSNLFYGQFWGFRLRDRKVLSNEPHTDFETHLFPAGCGTISIHNCMCIVSGCQLSRWLWRWWHHAVFQLNLIFCFKSILASHSH